MSPATGAQILDEIRSRRIVEADDRTEEVGAFDLRGDGLFFDLVRPKGPARSTGIVVVPSHFEMAMLQGAETALLRSAAGEGVAGIYAQAPGTGDSEGDPRACTIATRIDAAVASAAELIERVPEVERVCFFGARLGGLVATAAALHDPRAAAAVLWDPALDTEAYWKQIRRLVRVSRVIGRNSSGIDPDVAVAESGEHYVLGFLITRELLADLLAFDLEGENDLPPSLVVSSTPTGSKKTAETLAGYGTGIEAIALGRRDVWGLGIGEARAAIEPTLRWVKDNLR